MLNNEQCDRIGGILLFLTACNKSFQMQMDVCFVLNCIRVCSRFVCVRVYGWLVIHCSNMSQHEIVDAIIVMYIVFIQAANQFHVINLHFYYLHNYTNTA